MIRVYNLSQAKIKLFQKEVLVYKQVNQPITFLILKNESRITKINEHCRYNISLDELEQIIDENKVYIFEKENQVEINQEFKKLIQ